MRRLAWLCLVCGPLAVAPAAAGLWLRQWFSGVHGGDDYALAGAAGALLVEGLLFSFRGLVRQATVLVLSLAWACWLWFGMTDERYDWLSLPPVGFPDGAGRAVIPLIALIYLMLFMVTQTRPHTSQA
jgi:hypothetical protein